MSNQQQSSKGGKPAAQSGARPPVSPPPPPSPSGKKFGDLFVKSANVALKMRVCLWGWEGTHKTRTALGFPRPAVISVDGLAEIYANEFPDATFYPAHDLAAVERGLQLIIEDKGQSCDTVIIDSMTPIYDGLKDEYLANAKGGAMGYLNRADRDRINIRMKRLYSLIAACPVHVVIIVRATDEYSGGDNNASRIGDKTDADKFLGYAAHFIVHMTGGGAGVVTKYQGVPIKDTNVKDVSWAKFWSPIAAQLGAGDDKQDIRGGGGKELFLAYWHGRGLTNVQIVKALGVKSSGEWTKGRIEADQQIEQFGGAAGWFKPAEPEPQDFPGYSESAGVRANPFGASQPAPNGSESS